MYYKSTYRIVNAERGLTSFAFIIVWNGNPWQELLEWRDKNANLFSL